MERQGREGNQALHSQLVSAPTPTAESRASKRNSLPHWSPRSFHFHSHSDVPGLRPAAGEERTKTLSLQYDHPDSHLGSPCFGRLPWLCYLHTPILGGCGSGKFSSSTRGRPRSPTTLRAFPLPKLLSALLGNYLQGHMLPQLCTALSAPPVVLCLIPWHSCMLQELIRRLGTCTWPAPAQPCIFSPGSQIGKLKGQMKEVAASLSNRQ